MNEDIKNDLKVQKNCLFGSHKKPHYYHWIIQYEDKDVGFSSFLNCYRQEKTTQRGFYIGVDELISIDGLRAPYFYNFAFDILGSKKTLIEVFHCYKNVIEAHLKEGYCFDPKSDHYIKKNGQDILIVYKMLEHGLFKALKPSRLKQELSIHHWEVNPLLKDNNNVLS